jgi:hypothetical protein
VTAAKLAAKAVIEASRRPFGMRVTERSSSSTIEGLDDNSTDS